MAPPFARSIVGYDVLTYTSPAATTSEPRKCTRMSPSVWAFGSNSMTTASPLKEKSLRLPKNTSVGQAPTGGALWPVGASSKWRSVFSCAKMNAVPPPPVRLLICCAKLPATMAPPDFASNSLPPV